MLDSTRVFRLARATALNVVVMDFVEAARLRGEGMGWIVFKEIVPNILPPLITEFGLRFCFVFLTISALSFLGVGIQPPTADWGSMVAESKTLITFGAPQPLIPAACHCAPHRRRELRGRLVPAQDKRGCAMSTEKKRVKGEVLLEIKGLKIEGYCDDVWHPIVKGVDLTLKRGEVLGLIGESGAGKSTLGLAAMGFARPGCRIIDGSIMFDGIDLRAASEEALRELRGLAHCLCGAECRRLLQSGPPADRADGGNRGAPRHHEPRPSAEADARDLYKRLQLPNPDTIGDRYPHQVSGGQLQRAMTAMAMSCRPDLIIFDEPTTALDVTTQVEVLAAMRDIVEQFNTAAIYITHDLAVVAQMAHRIMVLRYGKLVEEAPTREMLKQPKEDYTKTLWAVRKLEKPEVDQRRHRAARA